MLHKMVNTGILISIIVAAFFSGACDSDMDQPPQGIELQQVVYTPSDAIFPNPERGFYKYTECNLEVDGPINPSTLNSFRESGYTLIYRIYYLKNFRDRELTTEAMETMEVDMQRLRNAGIKCVLRFAYSQTPDEPDAPLDIIETHLDQLKPWFEKNFDVIAVMQAGFIGAWGEWYYTSNNLNTSGARAAVLDKILEVLPEERMVQVRTPQYKTDYLQSTEPLKFDEAFSGSKKSRVGHHNDCFLASPDDYGTYQNVEADKKYISQDAQYVPVGGETCPPSGIDPADCEKAEGEMRYMHWSYLNDDYYNGVNDRWKTEGCMDDIRRELGYRFVLKEGSYSPIVAPGHSFIIKLELVNEGYAAPYNPRLLEFILINNASGKEYLLSIDDDPRRWKSESTIELDIQAGLPENTEPGQYKLFMNLPDPEPMLYNDPNFSIRLANQDMWNSTTGYNDLQVPVSVSLEGETQKYTGDTYFTNK